MSSSEKPNKDYVFHVPKGGYYRFDNGKVIKVVKGDNMQDAYEKFQSSSELHQKLLELYIRSDISNNRTDNPIAFAEYIKEIEALIKKDRQELLKRIELPKKLPVQPDVTEIDGQQYDYEPYALGYNKAIDQTKAIINAIRESI